MTQPDFHYTDGQLYAGEIAVQKLADEFDTPLYTYLQPSFEQRYRALEDAFASINATICFSIKSCHNVHVLRVLRGAGAAFDAVSAGEVRRALDAEADPADIVFAGVGKTDAEIHFAIEAGVGWFNAESAGELDVIARIAAQCHQPVNVALRVNPDVDAKTHPYTATGRHRDKFGVAIDQAPALYARYKDHPHLRLAGVHMHIGSLVRQTDPYVNAIQRGLALIENLRAAGHAIELLNLGGGFAVSYDDQPTATAADYAAAIVPLVRDRDLHIHFEPGRFIAAPSGVLLTRVVQLKETGGSRFAIVDASMTELIRPALYDGYHFIWPVTIDPAHEPARRAPATADDLVTVDVVGPVCESGDFLGKQRALPPLNRGDLLAVFDAGAYGAVMSSQYNSRPRAAELLVNGSNYRLIRRRETYEDLVAPERACD